MKKLDLQTETNLLQAKQIIKRNNCSPDIIDWAILLMKNGYRSENLYILAGLDINDVWSIDTYFRKTIEDLKIDSDIEKQTLLDFYLIYYIKASISNPSILDKTIWSLTSVIYDTSYYSNKHLNFFFLYDELEELTEMSREEYAMNEFKAFINELENI